MCDIGEARDASREERTALIFRPKPEHCGIWQNAPNPKCHASFGDKTTTASVSCMGNLIQMSRFLGAGSSGVFTIDHTSVDEPYLIKGRAEDLHNLANEDISPEEYSFGLQLPEDICPKEPPQVQWVNWRWPRYDWEAKVSEVNVKAVVQWVVHEDIVLQQVVLENLSESPMRGISFKARKELLIRDLDYLDSSYMFNESATDGYSHSPAPEGLGWVTRHVLKSSGPGTKAPGGMEAAPNNVAQQEPLSDGQVERVDSVSTESDEHQKPTSPDATLNPDIPRPDPPSNSAPRSAQTVPTFSQPVLPTEQLEQNIEQHPAGTAFDTEVPIFIENQTGRPKHLNDTWSARGAHSVVSVMTLYSNGIAIEMHPGAEGYHNENIDLGARSSGTSIHELVLAYKLVVLPDAKVHWRNFLVTAEESDVSRILREETERLWEDCPESDRPLCKLGLSMTDGGGSMQTTSDLVDEGGAKPNGLDATNSPVQSPAKVILDEMIATSAASPSESTTGPSPLGGHQSLNLSDPTDSKAKAHSMPTLSPPKGLPGKSSPKNQIEYLNWRHLEHILSVCAVPLLACTLFEDTHYLGPGNHDEEAIVALTCGDMSGHRICTSASLCVSLVHSYLKSSYSNTDQLASFAFQFLVDVLCRLRKMGESSYIRSLRHRVESVCKGHIRWLEWLRKTGSRPGAISSLLDCGCFAANYWLNGGIMTRDSQSWQPQDALTDMPFEVLKLTSYTRLLNAESKEMEDLLDLMKDVWVPWLHELDDLDRRGAFAWVHTQDDGINTYRLDDHVWLWRSLAALKDLGLWDHQPLFNSANDGNISWSGRGDRWIRHIYDLDGTSGDTTKLKPAFDKFSEIVKRLLPVDVQRGVLQRFTTENEVSRKRMLAVTRSPRDTRFLLHARDTSLFYGHDWGFFLPGTSFDELWRNTVEAQLAHEENQEESWENVLRFALGVVAGTRGFSLNKKSPIELSKDSIEVIIRSSAHNGFIPGELDAANKTPSLYADEEDRDYYYCVGFEVSHILLAYARDIDGTFLNLPPQRLEGTLSAPQTTSEDRKAEHRSHFPRHLSDAIRREAAAQSKRQQIGNDQPGNELDLLLKRLETTGRLDGQRSLIIKKAIPFSNSMIDASSITNIGEEWLYNYPAFLLTKKINLDEQLPLFLDRNSDEYISDSTGIVINQIHKAYEAKSRKTFNFSSDSSVDVVTFVANTPKQKRVSKRQKRHQDDAPDAPRFDNKKLWDHLSAARTASDAKKRFVWLPHASTDTAFLCWVASTQDERPAMSLFFDRHAKFEKHLGDDTTMVLNTWDTELHLSFFVLAEKTQAKHVGLPPMSKAPFPGNSKKELRRASMGFRFVGDFFDRYWTCHFIQYIPNLGHSSKPHSVSPQDEWDFDFDSKGLGRYKEKHWWQRKVLELHLLLQMLSAVINGCIEILRQVKTELGLVESTPSISGLLKSEAYASSKDNWQKFEHILQAVDEDITAVLDTLQKWNSREEARGQERPRWTRNDERKYRGYINKFRGQTDRQMWDLEVHRDKIRKLRELLTTSREKIRDDLEIKREENIRYFTYVTVIFLPLGFAASFYSMNGAPEHALIISLVEFAAAAFAVTITLLFCAKAVFATTDIVLGPLERIAKETAQRLEKYFRAKRQASLLFELAARHVEGNTMINEDAPQQESRRWMDIPEESTPTHWLWLAYFLLELPARRLSLAIGALEVGVLSSKAAANVFIGIVLLPIYGVSRMLQVVAINFLSLGRIFGKPWSLTYVYKYRKTCQFADWSPAEYIRILYLSSESKPKDSVTAGNDLRRSGFRSYQMTKPPSIFAPLRTLEDRLQGKKNSLWEEKKRADEVTEAEVERAEGV